MHAGLGELHHIIILELVIIKRMVAAWQMTSSVANFRSHWLVHIRHRLHHEERLGLLRIRKARL